MGRVRRQRKFKACDPFSKQKITKDDKFDRPPSKKELKDDDHFKETASFHKFQQSIDRVAKKGRTNKKHVKLAEETNNFKKGRKCKMIEEGKKPPTQRLPDESDKQFFSRLDQDVKQAITAAYSKNKTLRKKRKLHLKAREDKKKEAVKKKQEEATKDFNALKDHVAFGERVDAPPNITAAPRKAEAIKKQNSIRGLQLSSLLESDVTKSTSLLENNVTKSTSSSDMKRRRDMTDSEKESFDLERQRVINAYRLSKKRREMKGMT